MRLSSDNLFFPTGRDKIEPMRIHDEPLELTADKFENCAAGQPVLKIESEVRSSSEGDPFGAFLLAAVEIFIANDSEGE